ncbi:endoribonuclease [Raphanus sativus]|nr:endoribonuclease [Raphanus sativus]
MKVVALVSGGKDSCYVMMKCIQYGHENVALANLLPVDDPVDELDSYMYQTVGHQIIVSYAECMNVPLFRRIRGSSRHQKLSYKMTPDDEVEDMFVLLSEVKRQIPSITAVSSGAIASDYQRLRVKSICSRLGLVSLAFLWKQDQTLLLQEMIANGIKAILVKVAAIGLDPSKHLGKDLAFMEPHLLKLKELYGSNVCGEGGEYETLTLDCPLFTNARIVLDEFEVKLHSPDSIAPVGVLHPTIFHIEKKGNADSNSVEEEPGLVFELNIQEPELTYQRPGRKTHSPFAAGLKKNLVNLQQYNRAYVEVLVANDHSKRVLHVQSISSWAPSCIGPYSQAQFAELNQALRNSEAIAEAFRCSISSSAVLFVVFCSARTQQSERNQLHEKFVSFLDLAKSSRRVSSVIDPIFLYILVPDLPKRALVEVKPVLYVEEDTETDDETRKDQLCEGDYSCWGYKPEKWHQDCADTSC